MTSEQLHRTRRERQLVEVAAAYEAGDESRATALARDHLAEFPEDLLLLPLQPRSGDDRRPLRP